MDLTGLSMMTGAGECGVSWFEPPSTAAEPDAAFLELMSSLLVINAEADGDPVDEIEDEVEPDSPCEPADGQTSVVMQPLGPTPPIIGLLQLAVPRAEPCPDPTEGAAEPVKDLQISGSARTTAARGGTPDGVPASSALPARDAAPKPNPGASSRSEAEWLLEGRIAFRAVIRPLTTGVAGEPAVPAGPEEPAIPAPMESLPSSKVDLPASPTLDRKAVPPSNPIVGVPAEPAARLVRPADAPETPNEEPLPSRPVAGPEPVRLSAGDANDNQSRREDQPAAVFAPSHPAGTAESVVPPQAVKPDSTPLGSTSTESPQSAVKTPTAAQSSRVAVPTDNHRPATPVREIAIRLPDPETPVNLHIVERSGRVVVDVRTTDTALSADLISNAGDLVADLNAKGFATDTIQGPDGAVTEAPLDRPERAASLDGSGEASTDDGRGRRHGDVNDQPRHQNRRSREAWAEYLDRTYFGDPETERSFV